MNNDFKSLVMWFTNDFHSWLRHSWKSLANQLSRDRKSLYTVTYALFDISFCVAVFYFREYRLILFKILVPIYQPLSTL